MGIRQGTRTPLRGVARIRVAELRVSRPQCRTADAACTAAPVRARALQRVWQDRGARAGSTAGIPQKAERNKNACVSFCNRLETC
jgi:hypothetical protein